MEIGNPGMEAPLDHGFRDIVSTLRYAVRHPRYGQIFAWQLEKEQGHLKTGLFPLRDHRQGIENLGVKAGEDRCETP